MWQKLSKQETLSLYQQYKRHGNCPSCGHDHVNIRRMSNSDKQGYSHHPYCRDRYFWRFTCASCKSQWVSVGFEPNLTGDSNT